MKNFLRPCLVIGTGFHRWVLGESMQGDFKPLLDWNELLLEVARELHLPLERTDGSLSLHWERLLTEDQNESGYDRRTGEPSVKPVVSVLEKEAKKIAATILLKNTGAYPVETRRAKLPLSSIWGAVVSLNFDAHWLADPELSWKPLPSGKRDLCTVDGSADTLQSELLRLNNHSEISGSDSITRRLWFPNGYVGNSGSLRLGLREFGFQPVAIYQAFNALKAFEKKEGGLDQCVKIVQTALEARGGSSPQPDHAPLPLTWVTEMLYRPVCFAGVGMSDAEFGLWWLMVQRARNLAGVCPELRPHAVILVKNDDPRLPFWRTKPCGIVPLICATWDEGWEQIADWAESMQKAISSSVRT